MRARCLALVAAVAGLFASIIASPPPAAAVNAFPVTGLRVEGGNVWHADDSFALAWDQDEKVPQVEFTVRDAAGNAIPGVPVWSTAESIYSGLRVPAAPGVYLFEIWRSRGGERYGPSSRIPLYFDDSRPAPVALAAPIWVSPSGEFAVHVSAPAAPLPISGIAGYAISLDGRQEGTPCARPDRCTAGEVNLPGGTEGATAELHAPPEGIGFVHAVAVSGSGMASSAVATARFGVDGTPPTVRLEGQPSGWSDRPVTLTALATDPLSGMAPAGPAGPITAIAVDGSPPQLTPGASATTTVAGEGVHQVAFFGRDAVGNSGDGSLPFAHPGTATIRIDETGPTVRFAAGDLGDPERIEATVADARSGPDPERGTIELRPAGDRGRFRPLPTDATRAGLVARWNSDDYPRGDYEFRATGYDLAGNATTSSTGPEGGPFVLHDPVKREARLAFGFGAGRLVIQRCSRADGGRRCHRAVVRSYAKRPAARTLSCCHATLVGGRLVDADGQPLAGQTVEVVETLARGARNADRRTALTTDADGRFSTRLAPGPSRAVSAEFPGTRRLTRALGRGLRLRVRAAVHLSVSSAHAVVGGPPVLFSGRIAHPEASLPASGLPVELEFRLPGVPWTQFRTVQSDAAGRFRYPYEFSDDDSAGVRFQFRAFVAASGNWPFAPATSRPLTVTG